MAKYKYYDSSKTPSALIFECEATSILEADKQINAALGIKVEKCAFIGCRVEKE